LAKAVGLDIGSRACKVAVLSSGGKGAKLLRYVEKEYDLGTAGALTPAAVLTALRQALSEAKAPRNSVAFALPAELCTLREITVPFTEDDQIKKVVRFEFEPHLHASSIDDVIIDYVKTGASKGGTRLLVIAASKEMLRSRLDQLKEAGVDPLHMDVDVASLFNTATQAKVFEQHANCMVIDIGARTTKTLLVQDGRLKVARSIRLGAQGAVQRLTSEFEGDAAAARQAMEDAAGVEALAQPPGQASTLEIVASVRAIEAAAAGAQESDFLSRVLRETQRTMPAMAQDRPLTRIFLTGGGAARPHARQRIAEHYGVEVEDLPTMQAVSHSLPPSEADKVGRGGAVAIGAALKVLGIDAGEIDMRRDEFRFARTFDAIKVALATGVTLVFFGLFLFAMAKYMELSAVNKQRKALRDVMEKELRVDVIEEYEKSVKDAHKASTNALDEDVYFQRMKARLTDIRNHLKNELGLTTEVPPIRSCLEPWSVVMACVKTVRLKIPYLAIAEESYTQDKIDLKIVFGDIPEVDQLTQELRKHVPDLFESVETGQMRQVKDKGYEIPIKIALKVKESDEPAKGDKPADAAPAGDKPSAPATGDAKTDQKDGDK
jgi:type IV pilus assembly protein PilM